MSTAYLNLPKAEIEARQRASQVRQAALKRLPTILADQLLLRLQGLHASLPSYRDLCASWKSRVLQARLSQDMPALEIVEAEYLGLLISKGLDEHWYKPDEAGLEIVRKHMEGLDNALLQQKTSSGESS